MFLATLCGEYCENNQHFVFHLLHLLEMFLDNLLSTVLIKPSLWHNYVGFNRYGTNQHRYTLLPCSQWLSDFTHAWKNWYRFHGTSNHTSDYMYNEVIQIVAHTTKRCSYNKASWYTLYILFLQTNKRTAKRLHITSQCITHFITISICSFYISVRTWQKCNNTYHLALRVCSFVSIFHIPCPQILIYNFIPK